MVDTRPFVLTTAAGLVVGVLAIAFAATTAEPTTAVLFSGESAFDGLFASAATISLSTLALLLLFKGLAWSISLGSFRGGPTFPALFLGVVAGLMAAHLPGYDRDAGRGGADRRGVRRDAAAAARVGDDRQPPHARRPASPSRRS